MLDDCGCPLRAMLYKKPNVFAAKMRNSEKRVTAMGEQCHCKRDGDIATCFAFFTFDDHATLLSLFNNLRHG